MIKITFSKTDIIEHAWELTKKHFWFLVSIALVLLIINFIPGLFSEDQQTTPFAIGVTAIVWIINIFLSLGLISAMIKLTRNQEVTWSEFWETRHLFWRFCGASILYGLLVMFGTILFIFPGIYWSIKYQFFGQAIIDKDLSILESFKKSAEITQGQKWNIFVFNIILSLIAFFGIILFLIGLVVALPVTWLATAILYLKLLEDIPHLTVTNTSSQNQNNEA